MSRDWESFKAEQEYKGAFYKNKGKIKCNKCDFYNCICQLTLSPDFVEVLQVVKDPSHATKVINCSHRCLNSGLECLNCYDFDKFKMQITI